MVVIRSFTCHSVVKFALFVTIVIILWALFMHFIAVHPSSDISDDVYLGSLLFLTPYIVNEDIETAQSLAKVGPLGSLSVHSYSGFLTVNKTYNSNLFFWYFPSQTQNANDPVLLWLSGGPGCSSLFGLFVENGPVMLDDKLNAQHRIFSWNRKYHILYIDSPVGTGFSFTDDERGYTDNETGIADNLYEAVVQFFKLFPTISGNDFYITGESYAGKYIPALGHRIHQKPLPKTRFRGIAIGNGYTDPYSMIGAYADFLYQISLLDDRQRDYFRNQTSIITKLIDEEKWLEATQMMDRMMDGDFTYPSYYNNATGLKDYYNYLHTEMPKAYDYYNRYVILPHVRRSIHVGNRTFSDGKAVIQRMKADIMKSVKSELTTLMNHYKVMLYSGPLDVIVATPMTKAMLQTMSWNYADEFHRSPRIIWKVNKNDSEVAGYVRRAHDFYWVVVRGGGHTLPFDQPERSWDMIDRFISNRPFDQ